MPKDLKLINPNTGNCPIFRSRRDAEITKKIYSKAPVLLNEKTGENPWGISFMRMFDMSNDSNLFETYSNLIEKDYTLEGNVFVKGEDKWLPLYEAKMFWQYDHRYGTNENCSKKIAFQLPTLSIDEYKDVTKVVFPWYWVSENNVHSTNFSLNQKWILTYRDIARATDARTAISAIIPFSGMVAHMILIQDVVNACLLLGIINSIPFDFIVRQKVGGTHINFYIFKQFPVLHPDSLSDKIIKIILPKIIELVFCAENLYGFAEDVFRKVGPEIWNSWFPQNPMRNGKVTPFIWDEDRRFTLQRELDAIYAHLYGLSKLDLTYILDTFPIVERNDVEKYGFFKTKEDVLKYYDEYSEIQSYSS